MLHKVASVSDQPGQDILLLPKCSCRIRMDCCSVVCSYSDDHLFFFTTFLNAMFRLSFLLVVKTMFAKYHQKMMVKQYQQKNKHHKSPYSPRHQMLIGTPISASTGMIRFSITVP